MIEFDAFYFDGRSSARRPVRVRGGPGVLYVVGEGVRLEYPLSQVRVDAPMEVPQRRIALPGGGQLQTSDHAALAALFPGEHALEQSVHAFERRWIRVLAVLALLGAALWWGASDGLPLAAKLLAGWVPQRAEAAMGKGALDAVDRSWCGPTELGAERQGALRADFERAARELPGGISARLALRRCAKIGPNAFALPGGTVVVTDALARLAQNDEQLISVLAHELGHVHGRHSLRLALQSAGAAALVAALLGDAVSLAGIAVALPAALIQAGYSRDLEREADDYALARLAALGIPGERFAEMLALLEHERGGKRAAATSALDYLSTHPASAERIRRIRSGP
ncbi:MAG: M48 family metallopeptidase [Burkholderiales bacterium]|nr:M48 family metallopeptidase [Burkholderiales bacterium]